MKVPIAAPVVLSALALSSTTWARPLLSISTTTKTPSAIPSNVNNLDCVLPLLTSALVPVASLLNSVDLTDPNQLVNKAPLNGEQQLALVKLKDSLTAVLGTLNGSLADAPIAFDVVRNTLHRRSELQPMEHRWFARDAPRDVSVEAREDLDSYVASEDEAPLLPAGVAITSGVLEEKPPLSAVEGFVTSISASVPTTAA